MSECWIAAEGKITAKYEYSQSGVIEVYRIGGQLVTDIVAKVEREYGNQEIMVIIKAKRKKNALEELRLKAKNK